MNRESRATRTLEGQGTVTHAPPEHWQDVDQSLAAKYDVYSFAILLWELLTEKQPFRNGNSHRCTPRYARYLYM